MKELEEYRRLRNDKDDKNDGLISAFYFIGVMVYILSLMVMFLYFLDWSLF